METTNNVTNAPDPEFHIGFTMAGAASAGCYTAGVMDYFFQMMDLWEQAKNNKLPGDWNNKLAGLVPNHKVIVDVMGGTSAGGMTTMMSAIYAINGVINPVTSVDNKEQKKENILYDSWVLMGDTPGESTKPGKHNKKLFEKIFATDDLEEDGKISSLLNSKFIDNICDDAFAQLGKRKNLPAYISPDLEILLSHTMLRGVPLAIDFTSVFGKSRISPRNPLHYTFDHFMVSHFKINYDDNADKDRYLSLNPEKTPFNIDLLKLVTKATGAFPVGLKYRDFSHPGLAPEYIKSVATRNIFKRQTEQAHPDGVPLITWPADFPEPFEFVSVDGGAVNNEPFGEVLEVLKRKHPDTVPGAADKFALIMIDPFPDIFSGKNYEAPDDLFGVAPAIVGALWDQSKVKRAELLDIYEGKYYLSEIYPVRYLPGTTIKTNTREENAIACGAAMAFSGFLDIKFRHHDFFLGRNNARNFFKTYFSYAFNETTGEMHPIHRSWTKEMRDAFKFEREGRTFLPIIPDIDWLYRKKTSTTYSPFEHEVAWPKYDAANLFAMKGVMETRVKKLLELTMQRKGTTGSAENFSKSATLMKEYYRTNFFKRAGSKIGNGIIKIIFALTKGTLASKTTKSAITWILKDLEKQKLLQ